ncbi:hypothetical protein OIU74_013064 [Salix koriyanagi]|uniref:Uncharacterized protein n=1 Tax=Salix koriyanagi TaxID=2511006 RepID=A0A9Q0Q832_9ROSI|nr:hypothetical protein OIU74_013064 [Salix koriyanagi]
MSNRGRAGLVGNIVTDQKRQSRLIGVLLSSCWRHGQWIRGVSLYCRGVQSNCQNLEAFPATPASEIGTTGYY